MPFQVLLISLQGLGAVVHVVYLLAITQLGFSDLKQKY